MAQRGMTKTNFSITTKAQKVNKPAICCRDVEVDDASRSKARGRIKVIEACRPVAELVTQADAVRSDARAESGCVPWASTSVCSIRVFWPPGFAHAARARATNPH